MDERLSAAPPPRRAPRRRGSASYRESRGAGEAERMEFSRSALARPVSVIAWARALGSSPMEFLLVGMAAGLGRPESVAAKHIMRPGTGLDELPGLPAPTQSVAQWLVCAARCFTRVCDRHCFGSRATIALCAFQQLVGLLSVAGGALA